MKKLCLMVLFCMLGAPVQALPQDWPCDEVVLQKVGENEDGKGVFRGQNGEYQIEISSFDETAEHPFLYNCGNGGCWGIFKNLTTGVEEGMRFDCLLAEDKETMSCSRISGDEYLFGKVSDNEYRVELCGEYYLSLDLNQCEDEICVVRDSRGEEKGSSVRKINCAQEGDDKVRCVGENYFDKEEAYFDSIDEVAEKANLKRVKEMYKKCDSVGSDDTSIAGVHKAYQAQYKCYKDVVFYLIDTFQPRVADKIKEDFQAYLDAYEKMVYNQYTSLDPCRGSCGTIIEDYIAVDRAEMISKLADQYISAVSGYVNM